MKLVWIQLGIAENDDTFFSRDLDVWLLENARIERNVLHSQPPWKYEFMFAIWSFWQQRNKSVFQIQSYPTNLASHINSSALEFVLCFKNAQEETRFTIKPVR